MEASDTTTKVIEHTQHQDDLWRVVIIHDSRAPEVQRFTTEEGARWLVAHNAHLDTVEAVHLIIPAGGVAV